MSRRRICSNFQVKLNIVDVLLTLSEKIVDKFHHSKCRSPAETHKYQKIADNTRTRAGADAEKFAFASSATTTKEGLWYFAHVLSSTMVSAETKKLASTSLEGN